jgi:hypothetical protein
MLRRSLVRALFLAAGLLCASAYVAQAAAQGLVGPGEKSATYFRPPIGKVPSQKAPTKVPTTEQSGWTVEVRKPGESSWSPAGRYGDAERAKVAVTELYRVGLQVRLTKYSSLTLHRPSATSIQTRPSYPGSIPWSSALNVFRQMEALGDRVAFRFPTDGCYARAHIMAQEMRKMGFQPWKVWSVRNGAEPLFAKTSNHPRGYVTWGWHVAPVLRVKLSSGKVIWCVFDPSLFTRPCSIKEWKKLQTRPGARVSPKTEVTPPGRAPLWQGRRIGPGYTVADEVPQSRLDQLAWKKMQQYKPYQGKWHPRLDKDAPAWVKSGGGARRTGLLSRSPGPQKSATRSARARQRKS